MVKVKVKKKEKMIDFSLFNSCGILKQLHADLRAQGKVSRRSWATLFEDE